MTSLMSRLEQSASEVDARLVVKNNSTQAFIDFSVNNRGTGYYRVKNVDDCPQYKASVEQMHQLWEDLVSARKQSFEQVPKMRKQ